MRGFVLHFYQIHLFDESLYTHMVRVRAPDNFTFIAIMDRDIARDS